jgi:hypothetical protein
MCNALWLQRRKLQRCIDRAPIRAMIRAMIRVQGSSALKAMPIGPARNTLEIGGKALRRAQSSSGLLRRYSQLSLF